MTEPRPAEPGEYLYGVWTLDPPYPGSEEWSLRQFHTEAEAVAYMADPPAKVMDWGKRRNEAPRPGAGPLAVRVASPWQRWDRPPLPHRKAKPRVKATARSERTSS